MKQVRHIFILSIFSFFLGIFFHSFFSFSFPFLPSFLFFLILLIPLFLSKERIFFFFAFFLLSFFFGFFRFDFSFRQHQKEKEIFFELANSKQEFLLEGKVTERPFRFSGGKKVRFSFRSEFLFKNFNSLNRKLKGKVLVFVNDHRFQIHYGSRLRLRGTFHFVENFQSFGKRTFDYIHYLEKDRVYVLFRAKDFEILGEERDLQFFLYRLKDLLLERVNFFLPWKEAGLLSGILFGEKRSLPSQLEEDFRKSGLLHIVVLSGYNVSILIAILMALLSWIPLRIRVFLTFISIFLFTILVGAGATVIRASLMASVLVLSQLFGKKHSAQGSLLFVAFLMVLYNPWILVHDISFQLSFLATYGLIRYMDFFEKVFSWVPSLFDMRESLSAIISAQVMVLPLILFKIGTLSLVSPLVNMIVLFFVPFSMFFGALMIVSSFFSSSLAYFFSFVTSLFLNLIMYISHFFAQFSFSEIIFPSFSSFFLFLYFFLLFAFPIFKKYFERYFRL